jgi:N,N'-diacetyllegionaminate synthase
MKGPVLIAEIGMNADGNFNLNYELIRQAAWAGADVAKFQVGWRGGPDEINFMDVDRINTLRKWCGQFHVEFMVSIITPAAWELVKQSGGMDRYKVASRTVKEHPDMIRSILAEKKETYISLGMYDGKDFPFDEPNAKYLFCKSLYPTRHEDLKDFPADFTVYHGYSDHLQGIEGCLLALARGAKAVEKHFTLEKTAKTVHRDHQLSATPDEFRQLATWGRDLWNLQAAIARKEAAASR